MSPHAPTRSPGTMLAYLDEGRRHLDRALRLMPGEADIEALVQSVRPKRDENGNILPDWIIKPATARMYKQELGAILDDIVARQPSEAAEAELARIRIQDALRERRGRPATRRTASRKVKNATKDECLRVGEDLKVRAARSTADILDHLLPAYVIAAPIIGARPCEFVGAEIEGERLMLPVAKATNGRGAGPLRSIGFAKFAPETVAAIRLLVAILPVAMERYGTWSRLRNALSERLARSCVRTETRRLALYCFRHVAIATWKAAGLDALAIAALAGQASLKTQQTYAGSRHGWTTGELPEPDPELMAKIERRMTGPDHLGTEAGRAVPVRARWTRLERCPIPTLFPDMFLPCIVEPPPPELPMNRVQNAARQRRSASQ